MDDWRRGLLLAAAAVVIAALWVGRREARSQPAPAVAAEPETISLLLEFGVNDRAPRAWDGRLRVSGGRLLGLRLWRPRPGDQVSEASWKLASRQGANFVRRVWEPEPPTPVVPYVNSTGVVAELSGEVATVDVTTPHGNFTLTPKSIEPGRPLRVLNGAVRVDRAPSAVRLSVDGFENDFAALAVGPANTVYAAWVAYRGGASEIFLRRRETQGWSEATRVTEKPGDIFLVQLGRDAKDRLWAVWAQQTGGNFDLYGRAFDGAQWTATERLTDDPQPDVYHRLATARDGTLWLVWQGFRDGKSDIFARRLTTSGWSAAERVSDSPANDWTPVAAPSPDGSVHVVWDTYDAGNYDIRMRTWKDGAWQPPAPVAATPKFEAHATAVCDAQGRLWVAWNESGFHWGKDTGFLVRKQATPLYQSRWIGVAVREGAEWRQPADLRASLPEGLREYNDLPQLVAEPGGRIWLFFRHRNIKFADILPDAPVHRAAWELHGAAYDAAGWSQPLPLPFSAGRQDMRGGFAVTAAGEIYAAWPTDNRDYEEYLFQRSDVYAGRIPLPPPRRGALPLQPRAEEKFSVHPNHPGEPEDLKRIRAYRMVAGGVTYRIVRGDTHRHTEFSMDGNGDGSLQEAYRYALDAAELDFLGVSDHNSNGGPDVEYINWLNQQMADVFHLPGTFAPLFGYERSVVYPNGHRNVMFAKRGHPTLPIPPEEQKAQTGARALYDYLRRLGGIAISHTSATTMGTDWRDNDPEVEPLVEIYQGDRVSAEYEGAPKAAHAGDLASAPGGFRPAGYVWNAWAKGYKLGVQASSDHLSTHISYACTLVTDFTREGLLEAMRRRHSYGATDNIVLDYRMRVDGQEYVQGDIARAAGKPRLAIRIQGTRPLRQIDIIRSNRFVHTVQALPPETSLEWLDADPLPGESYYYVRVLQVDDQIAWSSPIWLQR